MKISLVTSKELIDLKLHFVEGAPRWHCGIIAEKYYKGSDS